MDQNSKQKSLDNLTRAETILVAVSKNADFDALASGLALYLSCVKLGKNASIIATAPSVSDAQKLYAVDRIGKFSGKKNLIVVVNDAVDSVDKVTYFLDKTKLKIVIHPVSSSQSISREQISFEESQSKPDLIFTVSFASEEELKQNIIHEQNIDPNTWIIAINKKNLDQMFAQVNVTNEQAASISEVTCQLFQELALPLDEDIAYNLYTGISASTNNFSPNLATPLSFETAAWLIKFGAGRASFAALPRQKPILHDIQDVKLSPAIQKDLPRELAASFDQPAIEEVEHKESSLSNWLKPPKVYHGAKSFDKEN